MTCIGCLEPDRRGRLPGAHAYAVSADLRGHDCAVGGKGDRPLLSDNTFVAGSLSRPRDLARTAGAKGLELLASNLHACINGARGSIHAVSHRPHRTHETQHEADPFSATEGLWASHDIVNLSPAFGRFQMVCATQTMPSCA